MRYSATECEYNDLLESNITCYSPLREYDLDQSDFDGQPYHDIGFKNGFNTKFYGLIPYKGNYKNFEIFEK